MKKIFVLITVSVFMAPAYAFRIEQGNNIIISQPVYEDLYIAGGSITINAPVYGDLTIAGGTININDSVTNDILLAGGTVIFNGYAGRNIRCAGGKIQISKNVAGDVVVAGGSILIDKGVTIGGLLVTGGDITVNGNVTGEIRGVFGEFVLNGNVAKDIDCRGGSITINGIIGGESKIGARKIIIGNNAVFNKNVRYWERKPIDIDFKQSLQKNNVTATYDLSLRIQTGEWYFLGGNTLFVLLWYLGMALLMILIIQYLFSSTMKKSADTFFMNTLQSFGYGMLFFITVPIAAVIAFVTIIAVPIGLLLVFGYVAAILLATVITSIVVANWLNNRFYRNWQYWHLSFSAFGLFIVFKLITLMPAIGWLIMLIFVFISFGSILLNINWKLKRTTWSQGGNQ